MRTMTPRGWILAAVLMAGAAGGGGCAIARNYDDPSGPVVVGHLAPEPRPTSALRVVTFNLKFGARVDGAASLLSTPPLAAADVIVLQEMDGAGTEQIARTLGMNYVYVPSAVHPMSDRDFGVAILSPWPISGARKLPLPYPHHLRRMRRAAAMASVDSPVGTLHVYAVHFETVLGAADRHRRAQARAVLADAAARQGPVIVAGDFNGTDGADELESAGFLWLTRHVHNTAWLFDFDHILVRGLCPAGDPPATRGPTARGVSDHRPVWTLVRPCGT